MVLQVLLDLLAQTEQLAQQDHQVLMVQLDRQVRQVLTQQSQDQLVLLERQVLLDQQVLALILFQFHLC
jgi:hypothetical protein